jgi:hypothetical protein
LWDTNIAIYYLQQQLSKEAENFIDTLLFNPDFAIGPLRKSQIQKRQVFE